METQAIVPGSLSAIAQGQGKSLAESFLGCDAIVLVDVSGSMDNRDSRGGKSRYTVALEELAALQQHMPGKIGVLAFSSTVQFCPGGQPPMLGGGTDLAGALRFAKVADVADMRFVIISDGVPDDERAAMTVAKTYTNRIDCIFVGPEEDWQGGQVFLQRLASASGGVQVTADRAQELAQKTATLLLRG